MSFNMYFRSKGVPAFRASVEAQLSSIRQDPSKSLVEKEAAQRVAGFLEMEALRTQSRVLAGHASLHIDSPEGPEEPEFSGWVAGVDVGDRGGVTICLQFNCSA